MKLGVVYDHPRWEEKHIIKVAKDMGVEVVEVPLRSTLLDYAEFEPMPDVVLQRAVSSARALSSTAYFEGFGVRVVNSSFTQMVCDNKAVTDSVLRRAGIPTPRTVLAYDIEEAMKIFEIVKPPIVIKPLQGSWGRLQARVKDKETLRAILEHREAMPSPQFKVHYMQEYINKPNRDMRVFVIGDDVPVGIYRISEKDWRTNTALGGRAEPLKITDEIRDLAMKAAEAVRGDVVGVDIVEDPERGLLVIEVNSNVDFKNTIRITGFDVGKAIVEHAISLARR